MSELERLSREVGSLLAAQGKRLAFAESCTGGLLGHAITNVAGSSQYFVGSAVVYSYEAKRRLLNVRQETLERFGAVSAEVAREMAQGARRLFEADIAVAVTGIAGPGGGTPEKPVGLVYLHLSAQDAEWGERHLWPFDREGNKRASAEAALSLLKRYLRGDGPPTPDEWVMEPIRVDAMMSGTGELRPRRFHWRGRDYVVTAIGRRWEEEAPPRRHILVEAHPFGIFHLAYDIADERWQMVRAWPRPSAV